MLKDGSAEIVFEDDKKKKKNQVFSSMGHHGCVTQTLQT